MEALDGQISQKPLRNSEMDFLGGLIMLQIIFLHISLTYTSVSWIKDFYKLWEYTLPCLGWYFFKGGMFYKNKKFRDVITGCTKKLLIPYCFFLIAGIISQAIIDNQIINSIGWTAWSLDNVKQLLLYGVTGIDGPIWYLIVFFGVKVSYSYLREKLRMQPYNIMLASFIVAFLLWYAFRERNYIFWIGSIFCNLVFFACGDWLRTRQYGRVTTIISLLTVIILACLHVEYLSLRTNGGWQEYSVFGYVFSYVLVLASIFLVDNIAKYIPSKITSSSFISNIGRQSMSWFLLHHFILTWSVFILGLLGVENTNVWAPVISIVFIFTLIPVLQKILLRYIPWSLGLSYPKSSDRLP